MKELLLFAGAVAVLAATGIVHGLRTDRWGMSPEVTTAAARLDKIPSRVGDWESRPVEIDKRQLVTAQVVGHVARRYTHGPTGRDVVVLIVSGRPGAIGAHSPDVCFQGAGFHMPDKPSLRTVKAGSKTHEFRHAVASKGEPRPETLSLWWSWSADAASWEAERDARFRFFRSPHLYKIYFIRSLSEPKAGEDAPTVALIRELLPQLEQALSPLTP